MSCRWVPAFAGMTDGYCPTPPVFPAKAGIQERYLGMGITSAAMRAPVEGQERPNVRNRGKRALPYLAGRAVSARKRSLSAIAAG